MLFSNAVSGIEVVHDDRHIDLIYGLPVFRRTAYPTPPTLTISTSSPFTTTTLISYIGRNPYFQKKMKPIPQFHYYNIENCTSTRIIHHVQLHLYKLLLLNLNLFLLSSLFNSPHSFFSSAFVPALDLILTIVKLNSRHAKTAKAEA